jgi:dipeptidyl aminopeptidase/acylaminoacyl peptidase
MEPFRRITARAAAVLLAALCGSGSGGSASSSAPGEKAAIPADVPQIYLGARLTGPDEEFRIVSVHPETGTIRTVAQDGGLIVRKSPAANELLYLYFTGDNLADSIWWRPSEGGARKVASLRGTPVWSPEGREFICTAVDDGRTWRLNRDGSQRKVLAFKGHEVADWSADGKWLLTMMSVQGRSQIYRMRPDGSEARRLTDGSGHDVFPRFSPDSRRIAWKRHVNDRSGVWMMSVDGSDPRVVVSHPNGGDACWSPDGNRLLVVDGPEEGDANPEPGWKLLITDLMGGSRRVIPLGKMERVGQPEWR